LAAAQLSGNSECEWCVDREGRIGVRLHWRYQLAGLADRFRTMPLLRAGRRWARLLPMQGDQGQSARIGITDDDQISSKYSAHSAAERQAQRREDIGEVRARRQANRRRRDRR
jgi:hypothetical protein